MRAALISVNAACALLFVAFFAYTFAGRDHADRLARDYAALKTRHYADVLVDIAEAALGAPAVRRFLGGEAVAAARREIADYRRDPAGFVAGLVGQVRPAAAGNPIAARALGWKGEVRAYFDRTLDRLVADLRIFSGSNALAAAVAAWLAWRRGPAARRLLPVSGLVLAAVVVQSYAYVDSLTFFRVLSGAYLGWWYPVLLAATVLLLVGGRAGDADRRPGGSRDEAPPAKETA